jgi:uncharacterized protein involved in cysteine biosynthesis
VSSPGDDRKAEGPAKTGEAQGTGRDETELERIDRNLAELLQELRVALPGVQVLFAFLFILPFNQGFADVTNFEKDVYLVTLLSTALASILLIAPSMHHRLLFRTDNKEKILFLSHRFAMAGMGVLGVAITGAVLLVSHYVFGETTSIVVSVATALVTTIAWIAIPLRTRLLED